MRQKKELPILLLLSSLLGGCAIMPFMVVHPILDEVREHKVENLEGNGYSFNVMIDNTPVIEFVNKSKFKELQHYRKKEWVYWRTMQPVGGNIQIDINPNYSKRNSIGKIDEKSLEVSYLSLSQTPPFTKIALDLNEKKVLPNGHYIFFLKIKGRLGEDEKRIYVEVKRDATYTKFLF